MKFSKPSDFMTTYNPTLQTTLLSRRYSLYQLSLIPAPSLFAVADAFTTPTSDGTLTARKWLRIEINDLLEYSEQELGVEPERIDEACDIIFYSYGTLTVLEFLQFFALCKRAEFGTFFGRTGPMQITSFLQRFLRKRNEEIEAASHTNEPTPTPLPIEPLPNERKEYIELRQRARNGDQQAIQQLNSYISKFK